MNCPKCECDPCECGLMYKSVLSDNDTGLNEAIEIYGEEEILELLNADLDVEQELDFEDEIIDPIEPLSDEEYDEDNPTDGD
jgi:hypothetical protein